MSLASAGPPRSGINAEPSARPWQYLGANPDGWWCPTSSTCSNGANPTDRIKHELGLAAQLHVANLRVEFPWFLLQPTATTYDWTRAYFIFTTAAQDHVRIQPVLDYTPTWDGGYNAFPTPADFKTFVTNFMRRYSGYIDDIEMWNEPDNGQSLATYDPARYVQDILIPGYQAVKTVAPRVQVIDGGSARDATSGAAWLSAIYANGGGSYFDIAAFHDYSANYGSATQSYQQVLSAHGQGGKPIWMGEYGVSDPTGGQQSSLIRLAMATSGLAMAQFYTLRDESVYTCCPPTRGGESKQYGVVEADGVTLKSSFATLMSVGGGPTPVQQPGPRPTSSPSGAAQAQASPTPERRASASAAPTPGNVSGSESSARRMPRSSRVDQRRTFAAGELVAPIALLVLGILGLAVGGLQFVGNGVLGGVVASPGQGLLGALRARGSRWWMGLLVASGTAVLASAALLVIAARST